MTFELPEVFKGTYLLEFSDPSFDGLEVRMGRHSFGAVDSAVKLREIDMAKAGRGELDVQDWGNLQAALAEFSDKLVWWNLTMDGKEVGTDFNTVRKLDLVFVLQVFLVWIQTVVGLEWERVEEADLPIEVNS